MDPIAIVLPTIAGVMTALVLDQSLKRARLPLDHPNERSLHDTPVPRSGGFVAVPVTLALWLLLPAGLPWQIPASALLLFVVSALDDIRALPVVVRLACHLVAASFVTYALLPAHAHVAVAVMAVLAIGWMTNLYNFMDGADGLAGGMALFGFGTYGAAAWLAGDSTLAIACWTLAGSAAGFLVLNFPPARVFLGDAGSVPWGLLAGALGLLGWTRAAWPAWFPVLVFSPFIVDATVTLARHLLHGERVWQAHREHYYQRLVRAGWGHKRTACSEYALMAICTLAALYGLRHPPALQWLLLAACLAGYVVVMVLVDRLWRRRAGEA